MSTVTEKVKQMTKHLTQIGDEVREMTDVELAQWQKDSDAMPQARTEQQILDENEAKAVARLALLDRLGLTEQEAQLLLGS